MSRVLVTRDLPGGVLERLRRSPAVSQVDLNPLAAPLPRSELLPRLEQADGLLCQLTDAIDAEALAAAPRLRVVANYAVGFNNVDVAAATARGIAVTNTPDVLTDATADLALGLLLAAARRISEGDRLVRREQGFSGWAPDFMLGRGLGGKTLGVVGLGRIGLALARRAKACGISILYTARSPKPAAEAELGAQRRELDELLREADLVSVHVPLIPSGPESTHHLLDARRLALLRPGAVLVNTSRGAVIDEAALVEALRAGRLSAGLDVYEREPELAAGLAELENVVLCPHLGSATEGTRVAMGELAVEGVLGVLEGRRPGNCVNPEVWTGS